MEDWILIRWNLIERNEKDTIRNGVLTMLENQLIYENFPPARTK